MLGVLGGLGGLAPELLAADPEGEYCGEPAIVTSRLPGRASVTPEDPYDFAGQLGRALDRIHAHPGTGLREVLAAPPTDAGLIAAQVLGAWGRLSGAPQVLTHYDYWSGNTLWRAGQLTGVVDWSAAGLAPSGFDVSWCRLDLVLLFDRAIADTFTTAYEAVSGASVPDLGLWDLYAATNADRGIEGWAPNYQGLGRADLGPTMLRQRLTNWTQLLTTGR